MKNILPRLKEINKHINFLKKNFTIPQFSHFKKYISGLIALHNKTISNISNAAIYKRDQSSLNRFLTKAKWDEEKLQERYVKKVKHLTYRKPTSLIIDDSIAKKTGKHIEEAQYHKNHTGHGYIFGHQLVTALVMCVGLVLPLFPQLYSKKTQSKIELAKQLIEFACSKLKIYQVIMDSWYVCSEIIKLCLSKGLILIGNIKSNRTFKLKGKWIKINKYYKSLSRKKKAFATIIVDDVTYKIHSKIIRLKGVGLVKLIISKQWLEDNKKWSKPFYIICTDVEKSGIYVIRNYTHRWSIETFHKDIKHNLGLEACQIRLKNGVIRHIILVTLAYAILKIMMFFKNVYWTIGECIKYIQDKEFDELIIEIIEIDDKRERRKMAKLLLLNENAKV